jgi:hypothetical protein
MTSRRAHHQPGRRAQAPGNSGNDFAKAIGVDAIGGHSHDPQSFGMAQGNGQMIFRSGAEIEVRRSAGLNWPVQILAGNQKASA